MKNSRKSLPPGKSVTSRGAERERKRIWCGKRNHGPSIKHKQWTFLVSRRRKKERVEVKGSFFINYQQNERKRATRYAK